MEKTKEEILNKKPYTKLGIDRYYGYQTVINVMQEYADQQSKQQAEEIANLKKQLEECKFALDFIDTRLDFEKQSFSIRIHGKRLITNALNNLTK